MNPKIQLVRPDGTSLKIVPEPTLKRLPLYHRFLKEWQTALLGYRKFEQCGLKIVTAFDLDPSKIGMKIHGKHVLPLEKMPDLVRRMHILIGIITVPAAEAQGVADLMVEGGIRAIWNFAPIRLHVPEHVIAYNEDLYCSLAALSQKLFANLQIKPQETSAKAIPASTAALVN